MCSMLMSDRNSLSAFRVFAAMASSMPSSRVIRDGGAVRIAERDPNSHFLICLGSYDAQQPGILGKNSAL